jgi:hypothetical protein
MRWVPSILLFLLSSKANGQVDIKGNVTDTNGKVLAYSNIVILNKKIGTITDSIGNFTLPRIASSDSVKVSHVGYETVILSIPDLQKNNNIVLQTQQIELNEIAIRNWNAYTDSKKVGFHRLKSNAGVGIISGDQLAVYIENNVHKNGWMKRVSIPLRRVSPCAEYFRVTIFNGTPLSGPKEAIFYTEKPITANEIQKKNWIDISESKVLFPSQGCFVSLEVMSEKPGCDNNLQTSVSATMNNSSIVSWVNFRDLKWIRTSKSPNDKRILTPRFSIEVAYSK